MDIIEKVNQHYVSWFYLKYWRRKNKSGQVGIWARQKGKKTYFAQGRNILANDCRFYRVEVDNVVRDMMRYRYQQEISDPHILAIMSQLDALTVVDWYMTEQLPSYEKLDVIKTNYLEGEYEKLETVFSKTLANLNGKRFNKLWGTTTAKNRTYSILTALYTTQLFRTTVTRNALAKKIREMTLVRNAAPISLTKSQKESVLKLITYIESIRLSQKLCEEKVLIRIYECSEKLSFYTSDAPAQAILCKVDSAKRITHFLGVMPLSPTHFMMIIKDPNIRPKIEIIKASARSVEYINAQFLLNNKGTDVYATTEASLM